MKKFYINGKFANWYNLNLKALNNRTGNVESVTRIPDNLTLKVTIADKFNALFPNVDEISEETSAYAMRKGKKRHFLLISEGRVIGWAAFHRKERNYTVSVKVTFPDTLDVMAKSEQEAIEKAAEHFKDVFDNSCFAGSYELSEIKVVE